MKLFNIFKKVTKATVKSNVQKLDKKQLNKIIGGADKERAITINTSHVE